MEAAISSGGSGRRLRPCALIVGSSSRGGAGIGFLGTDLLCAIFSHLDHWDLARCSAVCTSWHDIIHNSTLMKERFFKMHSVAPHISIEPSLLKMSMKICLENLAFKEHISALTEGSAEIHHWIGHSNRVSQSRMKRGLFATGVGDKVIKLWSGENCQLLGDYFLPDKQSLVDFDFDESKIVGLTGAQLCIWTRGGKKSLCYLTRDTSSRCLCMRYIDPEAVVGCEDGRARIIDMYSSRCTRIVRMHGGPVTCLSLDEQLILCGSSSGRITVADSSSGELVASLKSSFSPLGLTCMCFSKKLHRLFAGSTAGYSHCWDLRMLRPLWETRISSNVTYSINHFSEDTSTLAAGGIDGVLRILDQGTGEVISSYISDGDAAAATFGGQPGTVLKGKAVMLPEDIRIDNLSRSGRPPISCLAVGMRKIVTTHNEKYIRLWRFQKKLKG